MLNLDKFNTQLDIKNIDFAQILKPLTQHWTSLVKTGLIVGSLIVAGLIFNNHHAKDFVLRTKTWQAQQKIDVIKARDAAVEGLNKFKSSLPKDLNEFELITLISNEAKSHNTSIPSLSPSDSQDMGLYDIINIRFAAESDNFKDMMLFLRKLEDSDVPIRIDSWSGSPGAKGRITFQITISLVLIHK